MDLLAAPYGLIEEPPPPNVKHLPGIRAFISRSEGLTVLYSLIEQSGGRYFSVCCSYRHPFARQITIRETIKRWLFPDDPPCRIEIRPLPGQGPAGPPLIHHVWEEDAIRRVEQGEDHGH